MIGTAQTYKTINASLHFRVTDKKKSDDREGS